MAATDMRTETAMPQIVETAKMASRNVRATVVAFTGSALLVQKGDPDYDAERGRKLQDADQNARAHCCILS